MKKTKLKAFLFCFIIGCIIAFPQNVKAAENVTVNISAQYGQSEARTILNMINDMRTSSTDAWYWNEDNTTKTICSNLSKLTYDYDLERIAMKRAAEIAVSYSHTRPNDEICFSIYNEEGVNDGSALGENIAMGRTTAKEVNADWREDNDTYEDQGHRRNMLSSDFNSVGIGHVYYNGRHYWVEEFAKRQNINATETKANDEITVIPVSVAQSNITNFKAVFDKESYSLRVSEKVSSKITKSIVTINGTNAPVEDTPSISIENSSIASYSDGQITGLAEGNTVLKTTLYGLTSTSTPTVSVHDCDNHWDSGKITTEPTCTEKGVKTFTCTVCQNTKTEDVAPKGHDYAEEWTTDIAPTCEKTGSQSRHCKVCGDRTEEKSIPALGHIWKDKGDGTAACTREGCDAVHTHVWDNGQVTKEATCEEDGTMRFQCTYEKNCDAVKTEKINKLGHDYQIANTDAPTCTKAGILYYKCSRCESTKTQEDTSNPALGHDYQLTDTDAPTCTKAGVLHYKCSRCESTKTQEDTSNPELGHDYQLTSTDAPTCTKAGVLYYKCSRCGSTKTEEDLSHPALNHKSTEIRDTVNATCQKKGYTGDIYCTDCGIKLSSGESIPLTAHIWDSGKVTRKATYTSKGEVTYTCKSCGKKKKVFTPKLAYPKVGTLYTVSGNQYKVTKAGTEVSLVKTSKNAKNVTIPATMKGNGITYKVTSIGTKAFNSNKKLSKVTVGANIKSISNNAFFKCPALKNVTMKTVLLTNKTAKKNAFKTPSKKMVITVPKKVKKAYAKIFKGLKVK